MAITLNISIFKDLIKRYPEWEDLSQFIESEEGGLFRVVDKKNDICLIRYEKGTSRMDLPHSKWFRSVVWNMKLNRPLCVAPPKANIIDFSFKTMEDITNANLVCQEHLDGFMINCYKDDSVLNINSRSKLDATGKFYSHKTFRDLFEESYEETKKNGLNDIRSPNRVNNELSIFYSFLVQHKEHRIVKPFEGNCVYVIHKGIVYEDGTVQIEDSPDEGLKIEAISFENKLIKDSYVQITVNDIQNEVQIWIKKYLMEKDWQFQGVVFKDKDGNRWRFRSEKYAIVKTLRGNSPSIVERYSQMYTQNLLGKYLEYYPEDNISFSIYTMIVNVIINSLYNSYIDLHITKVKTIDEICKVIHPHLYSIHGIYLTNLRQSGKKINQHEIKQYIHKLPWQRVVFLIKNLNKYL